jgi:hypothetical protein
MEVPRPTKLLISGVGSLLLLGVIVALVGYLSAPSFYLTRSIFWGESDYKDLEKFPARVIHNGPSTFPFDKLPADNPYASQFETIAREGSNGSLEDYLETSGTTAFLVVHDDDLLYERYFDGYDETSLQTSLRRPSGRLLGTTPARSLSCSRSPLEAWPSTCGAR